MRPYSARMYPDACVVDPLGPAPRTLACAVQVPTDTRATERLLDHGAIESLSKFILIFPADPGVPATDTRIDWTAHAGVALATPRTLTASGPARPPSGPRTRWTVDCEYRI